MDASFARCSLGGDHVPAGLSTGVAVLWRVDLYICACHGAVTPTAWQTTVVCFSIGGPIPVPMSEETVAGCPVRRSTVALVRRQSVSSMRVCLASAGPLLRSLAMPLSLGVLQSAYLHAPSSSYSRLDSRRRVTKGALTPSFSTQPDQKQTGEAFAGPLSASHARSLPCHYRDALTRPRGAQGLLPALYAAGDVWAAQFVHIAFVHSRSLFRDWSAYLACIPGAHVWMVSNHCIILN